MNYWVMSDTHFGHDKLIKSGHRHPDAYNKMLNSVKNLSEKDVLIHLGDVSFYADDIWHRVFTNTFKGKKWLVKGNHDRRTNSWYLSHGWDFVCDAFSMKLFGLIIAFTHKPMDHFAIGHTTDFANVHGHLHDCQHKGEFKLTDNHYLVKMEHDYKPVNLRKLIGM